ncbi:hypothetical protein L1F30_13425 [Simiduia sp. 21SJ11W-1]|uniref:hypothetical protein n=1 Tax=Simiduia sp. 21SJ11W-1 TaxID=2909669 RepID=UPI0020A0FF20|nr:hypothetical protein [Simiduia sp. 21SJ11W-1]UTA47158.1 hypothetical protein L1F30_13425 [Simiduia sp. 21SJ11W-1]
MNQLIPPSNMNKWPGILIVGLLGVLLFVVTACSQRQIYDGIQTSNRSACMQRPPSQQAECISRAEKSYEQYQREREMLERSGEAE